MRRVAVTGIGLATALGVGVEATWRGLLEGRSGVGRIRSFDPSNLTTQLGAEVWDFAPERFVTNRRTLRMMTRNEKLALAGATLAVQDAGIDPASLDGDRAGLFVGGNKETSDLVRLEEACLAARNEDGTVDVLRFGEVSKSLAYPLFYVEGLQAASLFYISQAFDLKGANTYFAGSADASATAIGRGYRAIRRGEADVILAGGYDDALNTWRVAAWDSLGVLSPRNDLGAAACRPYDRDRTGTVLGEAAALLVLEDHDRAVQRGARIYAEICGYGSGLDTSGILTPDPEGRALAFAMEAALREAGTPPGAVQYVVSHGSGTRRGDPSEARAIRSVFKASADRLMASSVKAAVGHTVAAAGAVNVAVAALAIRDRVAPPTLNLEHLDPTCPLDWIPRVAREAAIDQALALARGLEGQNVAVALRAVR